MKRYILIGVCLALGGLGTLMGQALLDSRGISDAPKVTIPKELTSYRDIVKKILPAVVSLQAQASGGKAMPRRPGDTRLNEDPTQVGFGSGFIISSKGVIVTNNHVVEGADQVLVQMASGKKYTAKKIRTDLKSDMAILQLDIMESLPYLEFGDSDAMEIGDRVLAVGAPFGLAGTVTCGIISSKGRSLRMNMYEDFLQTDAAINPGNSGGPLINLEGKVIGINSAIKSRTGGFQGIGLAIASNLAKTITQKLLVDGVVHRGYLGVGIRDVTQELAREKKLDKAAGVVVTRLYKDAPGSKAGLKKGDIIVRLGGKPVHDTRGLQTVVAGLPLGKAVDIEVIREGKTKKLSVTIEEQPDTFGTAKGGIRIPDIGSGATAIDKIGVVAADLSDELAEALGYPTTVHGVLLTRISRRGLAARVGLQPGMVILSVEKKPVTTTKELIDAIADGSTIRGISLKVRGPRGPTRTVTLRDQE